jgi:hypothetical protein
MGSQHNKRTITDVSRSSWAVVFTGQIALEGEISKESIQAGLARGERASGDLIPWTVAQQVCLPFLISDAFSTYTRVPICLIVVCCRVWWCSSRMTTSAICRVLALFALLHTLVSTPFLLLTLHGCVYSVHKRSLIDFFSFHGRLNTHSFVCPARLPEHGVRHACHGAVEELLRG